MFHKKVDMLLGAFVLSPERLEFMDFPYVLIKGNLDLIMPISLRTFYGISAIWKPLQPTV